MTHPASPPGTAAPPHPMDPPTPPRAPHAPHILERVLQELQGLPAALRQNYVDQEWSRIPALVEEAQFSQLQAVGVPLIVTATTSTLEIINTVVVCLPVNSFGVLILGSTMLPMGPGTTVMPGLNKLIGPTDVRSLTMTASPQNAPGPCALWLTGTQAPTYGVVG